MAKDKGKKTDEVEPKKAKKGKGAAAPEPEKKSKKSKAAPEPEPKKGKGKKGADGAVADGFKKASQGNAEGSGDGWKFTDDDHIGDLFIITPTELRTNVTTAFGTADEVIVAEVVLVDRKKPTKKSEAHDNVFIFSKYIIGTCRSSVGSARVLGVLEKGEAKKGQSAPWLLADADGADEKAALEYLASVNPFGNR